MKETETLDDYKDMRANRCFFGILSIPAVINHDYTCSMVFDAYYFGNSKPEMKFINEYAVSNESGFLASTLTANGLKAALSNKAEDIVDALSDMVARSLLLSVLIESYERIHLIYEAPIPIGVTDRKESTRKYEIVFQKKTGRQGRRKNSEIETYALASAFPVSESIMPGKVFFRVGGSNVYSHPVAVGLESEDSENGSMVRVDLSFPGASDTDGNGGLSRAANDIVRRALELCGYLHDGRKDCFTRFPKTVIGTYPNPGSRIEDNAAADRTKPFAGHASSAGEDCERMFNSADGWTGFAKLAPKAEVMEFIPGDDGRIYMIFEAKQVVEYHAIPCAYDDETYIMKRIDGQLKAVGPVDRVREETGLFTAVFAPVESEDGRGAGEYAFSGAFPGRPDINPLVEGLEEGDMIYGSEVNARRLQPAVPES